MQRIRLPKTIDSVMRRGAEEFMDARARWQACSGVDASMIREGEHSLVCGNAARAHT